jgi:hypothetical protein
VDLSGRSISDHLQVHILPELKEQAKQFGNTNPEFDGIAEVWVDNIEAWKEIAADEEFVAKILRAHHLNRSQKHKLTTNS